MHPPTKTPFKFPRLHLHPSLDSYCSGDEIFKKQKQKKIVIGKKAVPGSLNLSAKSQG